MQKRAAIILVVILVLAGGAYALFHNKSSTPTYNTPNSSTNNTTPTNNTTTAIIQTKTASNTGQYLANSSGEALYTYSLDTTGVSNCIGSCLTAWPIYAATSSTALPANVTIIHRSDGGEQYAYKGMPLYTFTGDSPGQVNGNGVNNFNVAKP